MKLKFIRIKIKRYVYFMIMILDCGVMAWEGQNEGQTDRQKRHLEVDVPPIKLIGK